MFGFFKRSRLQSWEIELLVSVLRKLPEEFGIFVEQINLGLFNGVSLGNAVIPGYVGLTHDANVYNSVYDEDGRDFEMYGMQVYDTISRTYLEYSIFFSFGTIDGYALKGQKKINVDKEKVDVSSVKLRYADNIDFNRLEDIVTQEELKLINPANVYIVTLANKEYFHLMDIEDGDFYGIDLNKNLYKITHDPYNIEKMDISLLDLMGAN
jgi:hypothetical protein